MYAHQAIEDMSRFIEASRRQATETGRPGLHDELIKCLENTIPLIRDSQKFHMGDVSSINALSQDRLLFMNNPEDLRLPYQTMWFDYSMPDSAEQTSCNPELPRVHNTKEAALVSRGPIPTLWMAHFFTYIMENRSWLPAPLAIFIMIGGYTGENKAFLDAHGYGPPRGKNNDGTIVPVWMEEATDQQKEWIMREFTLNLNLLELSVRILNCKNIQMDRVKAPEALNRKRARAGKLPIQDYHILNVFKPGVKQEYRPGSAPTGSTRMHLCRGHIKTFTKEHPLMGKHVGSYWWESQLRGRQENGTIGKEYAVHLQQQAMSVTNKPGMI